MRVTPTTKRGRSGDAAWDSSCRHVDRAVAAAGGAARVGPLMFTAGMLGSKHQKKKPEGLSQLFVPSPFQL
jgi:hypothetical protein